jgi:predicted XRE-type DNA-binding protein
MTAALRRPIEHVEADEPMEIHRGSGDFLKDQGVADPEEFRVKALLANEIALIVTSRGYSQEEAAKLVGLAQPDVSRIVNGRVTDYSVWRLMKALSSLGSDILVAVHPARDEPGIIMAQAVEPDLDDTVAPAMGM